MFGWFKRREQKAFAEQFARGLGAIRYRAKPPADAPALPTPCAPAAKVTDELLPSTAQAELQLNYTPENAVPGEESELAALLEQILQGQKVNKDVFLRLYRKGYVFKEPGNQWGITEAGKHLIERYKVLSDDGCRINGVQCAKSWGA